MLCLHGIQEIKFLRKPDHLPRTPSVGSAATSVVSFDSTHPVQADVERVQVPELHLPIKLARVHRLICYFRFQSLHRRLREKICGVRPELVEQRKLVLTRGEKIGRIEMSVGFRQCGGLHGDLRHTFGKLKGGEEAEIPLFQQLVRQFRTFQVVLERVFASHVVLVSFQAGEVIADAS
eukprot:2531084-Rhodomonas_salina.2